jgi:hypothetical protein
MSTRATCQHPEFFGHLLQILWLHLYEKLMDLFQGVIFQVSRLEGARRAFYEVDFLSLSHKNFQSGEKDEILYHLGE